MLIRIRLALSVALLGLTACPADKTDPIQPVPLELNGTWQQQSFEEIYYPLGSPQGFNAFSGSYAPGHQHVFTDTQWTVAGPGTPTHTYACTRTNNLLHSLYGSGTGHVKRWSIVELTASSLALSKTDTMTLNPICRVTVLRFTR